MLEYASRAEERRSCFIWSHENESRHSFIGHTLLQVEDNRSEVAHDFLVAHGIARVR